MNLEFNGMIDQFAGPLIDKTIMRGLVREVITKTLLEALVVVDGVVMPYGSVEAGEMKVLIYRAVAKFAQDAKASV
jgi:hypothetical protein